MADLRGTIINLVIAQLIDCAEYARKYARQRLLLSILESHRGSSPLCSTYKNIKKAAIWRLFWLIYWGCGRV